MFKRITIRWSKALYAFRQFSGIASWAKIADNYTAVGKVIAVDGFQLDGDRCFDIQCSDNTFFHCEIMPEEWYGGLWRKAQALKVGALVRVTGQETIDPPHFGNPQELEIHPVTAVDILS